MHSVLLLPLGITVSILCIAMSCGFIVVEGQSFSEANYTSLQHAQFDSTSGTLTLDGSKGADAHAFYNKPISLYNSTTKAVISFATFFSFSSNSTSGNGTLAFVVVSANTSGLPSARKTLSIEFNASCSTSGGGGGGGYEGWFQVSEYANNISVSGYGPQHDGERNGEPYFCSQQPGADINNPTYQYQVVVEYNATTDEVSVSVITFDKHDLSAAIARGITHDLSAAITKLVYVGFMAENGAVYNVTQWNFTSNPTASFFTANTNSGSGSGSGIPGIINGNSNKALSKPYVVTLAVLGAGIGVAAVLIVVCCLCARKPSTKTHAAKRVHGNNTVADGAIIFNEATRPRAPTKTVDPIINERDTTPLYTGTASWMQPAAPR